MDIRPIKNETDYRHALAEIDKLWDAKADTPKGDRMDVLTTLVEKYEETNHPVESPDPVEAILFRMEQLELRKVDLAPYLGGKNRVTEVLQRKRKLTVRMIRRLYEGLGIPAEVLIG